ncbi:long-chain-fatty-acid--CoA ligase [Croceicoccus marinus]|uniref:Long-chain fatty acid--CoA ligase n=1 Tax=Croceicoccus marinus TaxID=450378 RepID=A0A7G6VXX0_9SPHN|nr:long-chain fatty acid--CoA ligase [Croceicoccus marinus]QNE06585.1 long-chain fatty acid--CoA ligase [Croceicoccus marinus]
MTTTGADRAVSGDDAVHGNRLVTDLLDRTVERYPERTAIDFMGRCWTYGEIGDLVGRAARGLQDAGLKPGDRFGLCLPNCPYFVVLYFAALRAGAIVVNFNPLYTESELTHQIEDSGTRFIAVPDLAMIHDKVENVAKNAGIDRIVLCPMSAMLPWLQGVGFNLFKRKDHARIRDEKLHLRLDALLASDAPPHPVAVKPDDVAVLQYTGGTTGVPKGAMLTHGNLTANSGQMVEHVHAAWPDQGRGDAPQERTLGVLPMFHVFALTTVLNYSVETGTEMVLLPRFEMDQVLGTIRRKPPTQFFGVPTIYVAMNALEESRIPDLSRVKCCISGGAPLPLEVREAFEKRTGARVVEGYGLSETAPIITCNPLQGLIKPNSCGPAFPGTAIEIRDPENPETPMPQGERGEICARGPQVMKGYWNRPDATEEVFTDGALRTGDIGYVDKDGYVFIVDRIKDVIFCGGYNVYPRVIEDAAYHHPAILEAVAIGIPDDYRGQSPKLFVALREGESLTEDELRAFLAERLSKIELPREFEFRKELPKTMIGKLSKKELVEEERKKLA